ncbi:MAG: hypothetical protein GY739_09725, partial [Mesoflavibacter sp.]|nr:hypothetical protein [Mesoflavibacter sp.]
HPEQTVEIRLQAAVNYRRAIISNALNLTLNGSSLQPSVGFVTKREQNCLNIRQSRQTVPAAASIATRRYMDGLINGDQYMMVMYKLATQQNTPDRGWSGYHDKPFAQLGKDMYLRSPKTGHKVQAYPLYGVETYSPFDDEDEQFNKAHEYLCRLVAKKQFRTKCDMDHIAKRDRIFQQLWADAAAKYDKTITQTSHEMLVHVTAEKEDRVYVPYGELAAEFGKGKPAREEPF